MRALVTGANGFLGTALCLHLQEKGVVVDKVVSKECDLTQQESLKRFGTISYDLIFHLAAWTQAGDFCLTHSGEQWMINQKINTNVLTFWHEEQPQAKLIAIGSSCGYDPTLPLKEENYLKGLPIDSLLTYAMTKRMLLMGLLALNKQYGHAYIYAIPPTLYGPTYNPQGKQLHFVFDLIRKIRAGKEHNVPVTLWGNGEQRRELLFVNDFVKVLVELAYTQENLCINVGSGKDYTIKAFAQKICDILDFDAKKILYDTSKYVGAKSKLLDVTFFETLFPSFSLTPLQVGLEQSIDPFLDNILALQKTDI